MARAESFRRLRRAFVYHFVLQFRFWLQREAKNQKQNRSSSALSAQTFPVRLKHFAPAALILYISKESKTRAQRGSALSPPHPPARRKKFGACGALSFTISFCNFASGCREKQTTQGQLGEERLRATLRLLCCFAKSLLAAARCEIGAS